MDEQKYAETSKQLNLNKRRREVAAYFKNCLTLRPKRHNDHVKIIISAERKKKLKYLFYGLQNCLRTFYWDVTFELSWQIVDLIFGSHYSFKNTFMGHSSEWYNPWNVDRNNEGAVRIIAIYFCLPLNISLTREFRISFLGKELNLNHPIFKTHI